MIDKHDINDYAPGMQQYLHLKQKYNDCIMLNRIGDFYEMFLEDALIASKELDLVLTSRSSSKAGKVPMCGVPYHSAQTYIARLVANGHKVAICEQLTEPGKGSRVVERDVVRVITPGTLIDEEMLEQNKNNYLLSVYKEGEKIGLSYVDISTGQLSAMTLKDNAEGEICDLIARILPAEVIGNDEAKAFYNSLSVMRLGGVNKLNEYYDWAFTKSSSMEILSKQFGDNFVAVFGLERKNEIISSLGALFQYLKETQKRDLSHIAKIELVKNNNYMTIDLNTRRNLEIVETSRERRKYGSILWVLDKTKTAMGARQLKSMVDQPLQEARAINERLDGVEELTKKIIVRDRLGQALSSVYDIERISSKISYGNAMPKDLISLKYSLNKIPELKEILKDSKSDIIIDLREKLVDLSSLTDLLERSIKEDCTSVLKDGGFIKKGFNGNLDRLRSAKADGDQWLKVLTEREREETGIASLKVGFNRVFGYYIEVNKRDLDKVPFRYTRKQTVANTERYITEDLKQIEDTILGSEEKAVKLELEILDEIKTILLKYIASIQQIASAVAKLDALLSLATVAVKNNYCRPNISNGNKQLKIVDGRHPVVEQFLAGGEFIANDTFLDEEESQIMVITGPNMAGKSTYMRQVAIITFLAHIGCFVPAREAKIPITDRIFTRVGASDDLAFGQSTFMVEMSEVAHILASATDNSLVILDEIGRGTSTFDGLSIAWAVVEHLADKFKTKVLFATHYHELTELEGILQGVKNYKIAVKEIDDSVVFLRKIVRGGANKSFGVEVARLAGVPKTVIERAKEISLGLEQANQKLDLNLFKEKKERAEENTKLALSVLNELKDIDINRISPMHSFEILNDLVKRAKEEK